MAGVRIAKHEGARRAELVGALYDLVEQGLSLTAAARTIASILQVHRSTVHRWEQAVRDAPRSEWARLLKPGYLMQPNPVHQMIWDSLRRYREPATYGWLVSVTESHRRTVVNYVQRLYRAGYVAQRRAIGDNTGRATVGWRLVRTTGPHAPRVLSGGAVYDQNRGVVFVPVGAT